MIFLKNLLASLSLLAAAAAPAVQVQDQASSYPTRPIKIIIGFAPGGSTDAPMRVLAESASKILKQAVIIENKPGAGGTFPAIALQSAPNDGYTLAILAASVFRLPYTTNITWDPARDISYVIGLTGYAFGIVVPASSPITTWSQYVAHAKAHPGETTYASPGTVTTNHLTMERIARDAGIKLTHVPFKGSSESIQALLGGHVQSAAETSAWVPYVESGKFRLLVVWGEKRMARFPNVPTLKESGINIVQASPWGIGVPKGTDPAIVKKIHDAFKQAMEMPNFKAALAQYEMEPMYMDSEHYRRFAIESMKRDKEALESLNITKQ